MAASRRHQARRDEEELPRFSNSIRVFRAPTSARRSVVVKHDQTVDPAKLSKVLGKPGLAKAIVFGSPTTPVFRAHPKRPDLLIRSFQSGRVEVGRIDKRGKFKVVKADVE